MLNVSIKTKLCLLNHFLRRGGISLLKSEKTYKYIGKEYVKACQHNACLEEGGTGTTIPSFANHTCLILWNRVFVLALWVRNILALPFYP